MNMETPNNSNKLQLYRLFTFIATGFKALSQRLVKNQKKEKLISLLVSAGKTNRHIFKFCFSTNIEVNVTRLMDIYLIRRVSENVYITI